MELSSTTRFLRGKKVPGLPGPVATVLKREDGSRILVDARGNRLTLNPHRLKLAFNRVLAQHQLAEALTTVRKMDGHRATIMLGGKVNGERLTFSSPQAAIAAAKSHYANRAKA